MGPKEKVRCGQAGLQQLRKPTGSPGKYILYFSNFCLVSFYAKPQVVKTVRAAPSEALSVTRRLRGVRVVHLVRDPRARLLSMREAFHGSSEVNM